MPEPQPKRPWMLVLCYLAFLGAFSMLLAPQDREVKWHARNGLLLFAAVVVFGIAATGIGILVPALSLLYVIVMFVVLVVYTVIAILAIVKALQGQRLIVPGVSRYADRRA